MDCRRFRNNHLAFVDDTLPGVELVAMQRHLLECEVCARHDSLVRRSLLVARNIPQIEPSEDFGVRLQARLLHERLRPPPALGPRGPGARTFAAATAGVLAAGWLAAAAFDLNDPPRDVVLAPVVATAVPPAPAPTPLTNPDLLATTAAGMTMWPVMYLAEEAPLHFASFSSR